jgi:hypothetical protein
VELVEPESRRGKMKAGWPGLSRSLPYTPGGTVNSTLGRGERRWDRIGAVYASDACQFRGI